MNSATLTKKVRLKPDAASEGEADLHADQGVRSVRIQPDHQSTADSEGLQPWQFFVLAGLGCATAITFLVRGQGVTVVLLVGVLMATAILVGIATLRTLRPLVSTDEDRVAMIGQRTRAALEREKHLTLRAIKELEFDRAMGKLAEADFAEMSVRLRVRAARIIRQLDAGAGYRDQIERDLAKRLGDRPAEASRPAGERACASCATVNDPDAKFCKSCGARL
jgi:hypothetical protein